MHEKRRRHCAVALVGLFALPSAACVGEPSRPAAAEASTARPSRESSTAPAGSSHARAWVGKVKATVDLTTLEEVMRQMPDNIPPQASRSGDNRVFTWLFPDGSNLKLTFRARGGEGSGGGLVLYMVEAE
jgi:hypothetical protein